MKKTIFIFLMIFSVVSVFSQQIVNFKFKGKEREVIILPSKFILPDYLTFVGRVNSNLKEEPENSDNLHFAGFPGDLNTLIFNSLNKGANIIYLKSILYNQQSVDYFFKAKGFTIKDTNLYKTFVSTLRNKDTLSNNSASKLVVYWPHFAQGLYDKLNYDIKIDGKIYNIRRNTKTEIIISKNCNIEFEIIDFDVKEIWNFKVGKTYYVRCSSMYNYSNNGVSAGIGYGGNGVMIPIPNKKKNKPELERVDELQAKIEMDMMY